MSRRRNSIEAALNKVPVDVKTLRKQAFSPGGFLTREYRRKAWPYLLNVVDSKCVQPKNVREHSEYNQVCLDVYRSTGRFPHDMKEAERKKLQEQLVDLILSVLSLHPELHYYQGYHDVCVTFLLVCGAEEALPLVERLSTHHLRDFMDPTMQNTTNILNYLIPLLEKMKPELVRFILASEVDMVFAISWLITWFSYVLTEQSDIERLYDFFLSSHPLMPIYFAAQIVSENSEEIMNGECEMARVYKTLLDLARKTDLPLESLISKACDFYIQYPPSSLAERAEFYKNDLAVSTFNDFSLVAQHEMPDTVLQRRCVVSGAATSMPPNLSTEERRSSRNWTYLRMGATALGGAVGAVVITALTHVSEWGPDLLSYL